MPHAIQSSYQRQHGMQHMFRRFLFDRMINPMNTTTLCSTPSGLLLYIPNVHCAKLAARLLAFDLACVSVRKNLCSLRPPALHRAAPPKQPRRRSRQCRVTPALIAPPRCCVTSVTSGDKGVECRLSYTTPIIFIVLVPALSNQRPSCRAYRLLANRLQTMRKALHLAVRRMPLS